MARRSRASRGDVLVDPLDSFHGAGGTFVRGRTRTTSPELAAQLEAAGKVRIVPRIGGSDRETPRPERETPT